MIVQIPLENTALGTFLLGFSISPAEQLIKSYPVNAYTYTGTNEKKLKSKLGMMAFSENSVCDPFEVSVITAPTTNARQAINLQIVLSIVSHLASCKSIQLKATINHVHTIQKMTMPHTDKFGKNSICRIEPMTTKVDGIKPATLIQYHHVVRAAHRSP